MTLTQFAQPSSVSEAVAERRAVLIGAASLAVASAAFSLAPYIAVYAVAVALFVDDSPGRIPAIAGLTAAALLLRALTAAAADHLAHVTAYRILLRLRMALADRLRRIPLGRVQARSSGELKKVLHDDVEQLEEALAHGVPDGAAAAAVPLATTAVLVAVDWRLALVALAGLVLLVVVSAIGMMLAQRNNTALAEHATVLSRAVMGYLNGIVVIRGYLRAGSDYDRVRAAIERGAELQDRATAGPVRLLVAAMSVGTAFSIALLLPSAGLGFASGRIGLGTLVLVLVLGLGYLTPIIGLVGTLATVMSRIQLAAGSVDALLAGPELPEAPAPREPTTSDVVFAGVGFGYRPDSPVLHDLDLHVPAGTTLAIVGATGSGKSTIARLLTRFFDVEHGAITIGGIDVREIATDELARTVAFVQQNEFVFAATLMRTSGSPGPRRATTRSSPRARRPFSRTSRNRSSTAGTPSCPPAAGVCPADSASGSRSRGPCSRTRPSSCSTRPPRRSTQRRSARRSRRCANSRGDAPSSRSPTGWRPSATATASPSSTRAGSWPREATTSSSPPRRCTHGCGTPTARRAAGGSPAKRRPRRRTRRTPGLRPSRAPAPRSSRPPAPRPGRSNPAIRYTPRSTRPARSRVEHSPTPRPITPAAPLPRSRRTDSTQHPRGRTPPPRSSGRGWRTWGSRSSGARSTAGRGRLCCDAGSSGSSATPCCEAYRCSPSSSRSSPHSASCRGRRSTPAPCGS